MCESISFLSFFLRQNPVKYLFLLARGFWLTRSWVYDLILYAAVPVILYLD